jgi:hypothetical protein
MHGLTYIFWANLIPLSLELRALRAAAEENGAALEATRGEHSLGWHCHFG